MGALLEFGIAIGCCHGQVFGFHNGLYINPKAFHSDFCIDFYAM
jgi:hypothetical protein